MRRNIPTIVPSLLPARFSHRVLRAKDVEVLFKSAFEDELRTVKSRYLEDGKVVRGNSMASAADFGGRMAACKRSS